MYIQRISELGNKAIGERLIKRERGNRKTEQEERERNLKRAERDTCRNGEWETEKVKKARESAINQDN